MTDPLPAETRWWHPVCAEGDLGARPSAHRLWGRELVVWRGGDGEVHAFDDRCPHRGAKLSLGRVVGDRLQCAYHGWCFDRAGRCVQVPATPDFVPPASMSATAWQARRAHGLVWVAMQPRDDAPPTLDGLPARRLVCGPYDVATSAPRVVENFLDTSHFGFVHAGLLGDPAHTAVPPYVVAQTADGRPMVPHYRAWQPRATAAAAEGAWVDYRYEVLAPFAALLHKQPEGGGAGDAYALFVGPLGEEHSRVWFLLCSADEATPDAELRAFQDAVFAQDRPVLESQRPRRLPLEGERHGAADRLSVAYRRWLMRAGVGFGAA